MIKIGILIILFVALWSMFADFWAALIALVFIYIFLFDKKGKDMPVAKKGGAKR